MLRRYRTIALCVFLLLAAGSARAGALSSYDDLSSPGPGSLHDLLTSDSASPDSATQSMAPNVPDRGATHRSATSIIAPEIARPVTHDTPQEIALRRHGAILLGVGATVLAVGVFAKFGQGDRGSTASPYSYTDPAKTYNGVNYMMMLTGTGLAIGGIVKIAQGSRPGRASATASPGSGLRLLVTRRF